MMARINNWLFYATLGGLVAYLAYKQAYGIIIAGAMVGIIVVIYFRNNS